MAEPEQRTEREFQLDVNQAVQNTEEEIFSDALGDEPLEEDGDSSLEEMGEGLEGDDLDEDEEEADEEDEEEEAEEADEDEGEEPEAEEADEAEPEQPQRGRPQVPLRQEREKRRAAEERERAALTEAAELRRQMAEMNGRLTEISARVNAPAPKPETKPTPKPDMFADPEGHERWLMAEAERRAEQRLEQRFQTFQQQQQFERETILNDNLNATANGQRGMEFQAAYRAMTSLPRDANSAALVTRITRSPDPGQAILDWFQDNGAEEWRSDMARQLGFEEPRRRNGSRERVPQQPRHEVRLPPSLNAARGGGRQQINDPEMLDDTDESVFRFATR